VTIAEALREAAAKLADASDTARLDAELLMAAALGVPRSELLLRHMNQVPPAAFAASVERRLSHEPVAYILGEQEFRGLTFQVSPAVLIPRGDSEVLVEAALSACPQAKRVLDCGTGSGALLLAVLAELPEATGIGIDRSEEALAVARANADRLGLGRRAKMVHADWTTPGWSAALGGPFDLVLANPPYVETGADLSPSVRDFEPAAALFAGAEGLDDYRILVPQLPPLLTPNGVACVEIGAVQTEAVTLTARYAGLNVTLRHDLAGRPRVLEMRRQLKFPLGKGAASH
jgi:release factor glutamine methyltransferase